MGQAETDRPRRRGLESGPAPASPPAPPSAANDDLVSRIVDSSVDGIIAFDRDCRYTLWNAPMERLTGVSRQKAVGAVAFELFPFLKEIGEDEHFHRALEGHTSVSTDRSFRIVETGREGWFEGYYSPLFGPGGSEVIGGVAIIRDVTERKRAEANRRAAAEQHALRDSEERYRAFIRNSSEGIWRFELETPVRTDAPEDEQVDAFYARAYLAECNEAMARMYGYASCDEIVGARLGDMLPRDDPHNL